MAIPSPHVADREQRSFNSAVKQRVEALDTLIAQMQAQIRQLQQRPVSSQTTVVRQTVGGSSTTAPGQLSDDILGALLPVSDSGGSDAQIKPGMRIGWDGPISAIPDGWLLCNGASLLVSEYPDLFAAIGYTWGGAGASFSLPDYTDRYIQGASIDEPQGTYFGATNHEIDFEHKHPDGTLQAAGQTVTGSTGVPDATVEVQAGTGTTVAAAGHGHSVTGTGAASDVTGDTGVNAYTTPGMTDPVDIRPQSAASYYIIKT